MNRVIPTLIVTLQVRHLDQRVEPSEIRGVSRGAR